MKADLGLLLTASAVFAGACALVLVLRLPVRRYLGATAAYRLWCLPLLCLLALALPAPSQRMPLQQATALPAALREAVALPAGDDGAGGLLLLWWCLGVGACLAWQGWLQHRFVRRLGRLQPLAHRRLPLFRAEHDPGLPALVGLLRPRIVLPADFEQRYSAPQRALLLRHESVHWRRGDMPCNAVALLLLSLQWFNPLAYVALAAFRRDQEMACDARVLARRPRQRRRYAEAMLLGGLETSMPPLGCPWPSRHPLKERLEMLKQPAPRPHQRSLALVFTGMLAAGACYAAWAAQPASPGTASATRAGASSEVLQSYPLPAPRYPRQAVDAGVSGKVVLLVDVRADGSVGNVVVKSAQPAGMFEDASVAAARQWRFTPKRVAGKAVASRIQVPVNFELDEPAAAASPGGAAVAAR